MSKYEKTVKGDIQEISGKIDEDILNSAFSMSLVDQSYDSYGGCRLIVKVYDK